MKILRKDFFKNNVVVAILAILCTVFWGSMIPVIKAGFDVLGIGNGDVNSKIIFAGACFSLSGLFLLIFSSIKEKRLILPGKRALKGTFILGVVQTALQYVLLYIGLSKTSGFTASIISSSGTFLIVVLSHFVRENDKLNIQKIFGCILGILGVAILNFGSFAEPGDLFTFQGEGMIFLSTLTFVFTTPVCQDLAKQEKVEIFTGYSFLIGGIILLMAYLFEYRFIFVETKGMIILIYLAFSASVAGALWNLLLKYNKISKVTVYSFLVPVFGALFSGFILDENIVQMGNLISLILTCLGIYFVLGDFTFLNLKNNGNFNKRTEK